MKARYEVGDVLFKKECPALRFVVLRGGPFDEVVVNALTEGGRHGRSGRRDGRFYNNEVWIRFSRLMTYSVKRTWLVDTWKMKKDDPRLVAELKLLDEWKRRRYSTW